ncbi:hypothetical protein EC957_004071 [Mortierella hygrophila]|uniref:Small ribosomal subunit protein mS38 n=1 Tax=Mortierella hygrophila TaxID=979708 RepID=A0A9P6FIP8_9FUNG|nr:hypothetical protein EC957_004071 [Mortierella hygrophila]
MLATLNNAWKRSASGVMAASTMAKAIRPAASSTIAMVTHRHQSSSSSPSSSSDIMSLDFASLVTSGERPIQASSMDRIDLAHGSFFAIHRPLLGLTSKSVEAVVAQQGHEGNPPSTPSAYNHMDSEKIVQDFFRQIENKAMIMSTIEGQAPTTPIQSIMDESDDTNVMHMTSVLRKRRIKMRKHKYKKLRKRTRALRKKLGK